MIAIIRNNNLTLHRHHKDGECNPRIVSDNSLLRVTVRKTKSRNERHCQSNSRLSRAELSRDGPTSATIRRNGRTGVSWMPKGRCARHSYGESRLCHKDVTDHNEKNLTRDKAERKRAHLESMGERTCLSGSSCKGSSGMWTASGPTVSSKASKGDKLGSELGGGS